MYRLQSTVFAFLYADADSHESTCRNWSAQWLLYGVRHLRTACSIGRNHHANHLHEYVASTTLLPNSEAELELAGGRHAAPAGRHTLLYASRSLPLLP